MNIYPQDFAENGSTESNNTILQIFKYMISRLEEAFARINVLEQRVLVVSEERDAAHASTREAYEQVLLMQHRCEDLDVPPACGCGRVGYEVSCKKCGVRLK